MMYSKDFRPESIIFSGQLESSHGRKNIVKWDKKNPESNGRLQTESTGMKEGILIYPALRISFILPKL